MPLELSLLLIVAAGIGGYVLGRALGKMRTVSAELDSYDCETKELKIDVTPPVPALLKAFAWDNTDGTAVPSPDPPVESASQAGAAGLVTIANVPHQNDVRKVLLQVWGIDTLMTEEHECPESPGSRVNEGEPVSRSSVLP